MQKLWDQLLADLLYFDLFVLLLFKVSKWKRNVSCEVNNVYSDAVVDTCRHHIFLLRRFEQSFVAINLSWIILFFLIIFPFSWKKIGCSLLRFEQESLGEHLQRGFEQGHPIALNLSKFMDVLAHFVWGIKPDSYLANASPLSMKPPFVW